MIGVQDQQHVKRTLQRGGDHITALRALQTSCCRKFAVKAQVVLGIDVGLAGCLFVRKCSNRIQLGKQAQDIELNFFRFSRFFDRKWKA